MNGELTKEERQEILAERLAWRTIFDSPNGKKVFRRIADECYFYNDDLNVNDPEGIALNNYFKKILERLGVADDPDKTKEVIADAILDAVLKLPLTIKGAE